MTPEELFIKLGYDQSYIEDKLFEEMGELTQALIKLRYDRKKNVKKLNNVIQEIADVELFLRLLKESLNKDEDIFIAKQLKLEKWREMILKNDKAFKQNRK